MSNIALMASVGVAVQGTLALLLFVVWRTLRVRWALLLSFGFMAVVAQYANIVFGNATVSPQWRGVPVALTAASALVAHALTTLGLLDYTEIPAAIAMQLRRMVAVIFAGLLLCLAAGVLSRVAVMFAICCCLCGWAAMFRWAMLREPGSGHGIVMLAVMSYPAVLVGAALGWVSVAGAGLALIIPNAVMGMTLLTTGLVRAQRASERELLARQRVQAELEHNNQTLELRVALRTAQLRETVEGLESFTRTVSHDLRGPLGGITGVARLARDAVARGDLADADRLLAAIGRQSESSMELVGALLQLARSSEAEVQRRLVKTDALVEEVVDLVRGAMATRAVVRIAGPLPDLDADPALLRQVFANLVGNGIKFSADVVEPEVVVGATRTSEGIVFHVRDNGVGFSSDQAQELFTPFRRLHAERFEGHGVGLTIVRRVVERHGGKLWAEGRPGQGATFFFTLQAPEAAAA